MNNLDETLIARECQYGSFEETAKRTSHIYHHMVYNAPEFINKSDMSIYYEALHMIAMKVSRLVNGGIKDPDGWLDIAGYAMLVHRHIQNEQEAGSKLAENLALKAMEEEIMDDKVVAIGG